MEARIAAQHRAQGEAVGGSRLSLDPMNTVDGQASTLTPATSSNSRNVSPARPNRFERVWQKLRRRRSQSNSLPAEFATSSSASLTTAVDTPQTRSPAVLQPEQETSSKALPSVDDIPLDDITEEEAPIRLSSQSARASPDADPQSLPATRLQSRATRYFLPMSYACLGGLMGTLTTLFAKSLINLFTATLSGDNQFNNVLSWVILGVTAATAVGQVFWINMGLRRYDALLQVPVFYCVWTVMDIIGGAIYYDEFKFFTPVKYVLFSLGVVLIFTGVMLLAKRLKRVEELDREELQRRQTAMVEATQQW